MPMFRAINSTETIKPELGPSRLQKSLVSVALIMATVYLGALLCSVLITFSGLHEVAGEFRKSHSGSHPHVIHFHEGNNEATDQSQPNIHDGVKHGSKQPPFNGKRWAVLVAGSNGYYNYRHQADLCHAYQILRRNGIPADNIITMMYDDVAFSKENPTPGVLINRPNGTDVYENCVVDYDREDVTPDNFIKVLLGNATAMKGIGSGKVLKSGPNDHVFVNFVDHGAPGLVAFPSEELHASKLKDVLRQMHRNKMYAKLVLYVEACESGSMFNNLLPAHWNIFATTAANSEESSYACYFDNVRQTYLGDVYSVMWMENADVVDLNNETLQRQFLLVREETNTSHVQEFGDRRLRSSPVSDFLGLNDPQKLITLSPVQLDPVKAEDVPLAVLERKLSLAESPEQKREIKQKLNRLLKLRELVNKDVMNIVDVVSGKEEDEKKLILQNRFPLIDFGCYEQAAKFFSKFCYSVAKNNYVASRMHLLVNLCERGYPAERIIDAMGGTCKGASVTGIY